MEDKKLTIEQLETIAKAFNLEVALVKTVLMIESSGSGFDPKTGLIKIQFESHIFRRYTKHVIVNGVEPQAKEWAAFEAACKIDPHSAVLSTSWGLGQIMGFNHKAAGYNTVESMVEHFKKSEFYQFLGMLKFIKADAPMYKALVEKNWRSFARLYNGREYEKYDYHTKLEKTYNSIA